MSDVAGANAVGPPDRRATRRVFAFTLRRLLWSPRTVVVAIVALLPVVWAAHLASDPALLAARMPAPPIGSALPIERITAMPSPPANAFGWLLLHMYLQCAAALAGVLYGTGGVSVAADAERGTLSLLLCRPVSRWRYWLGRRLAVDAAVLLVTGPGLLMTYAILVGPAEPFVLLASIGILALSVAAWNSILTLFGLFRWSLVGGLLFAFVWEFGLNRVEVGEGVRFYTLWHYQRSLVRSVLNDALFGLGLTDPGVAAAALAAVALGFGALACIIFTRREFRVA